MVEAFSEFVERVVRALNRSGLEYMLTGALASSYYGRPRTTLDMDVIVAVEQDQLATLHRWLTRAGLKAQEAKLRAALLSDYKIATIEDDRSPHTLDIIFTDRKLERNPGRILGVPTFYQTPESLILAKLRMLKVTIQPERAANDRADVKAILKTTRISMRLLRRRARAESTSKILDDLTS